MGGWPCINSALRVIGGRCTCRRMLVELACVCEFIICVCAHVVFVVLNDADVSEETTLLGCCFGTSNVYMHTHLLYYLSLSLSLTPLSLFM